MAEERPSLGARIRQCREHAGWTQNELARRSGVHVSVISRVEAGRQASMSSDNLRKLADTLQVSTDVLLGRNEAPRDPHDKGTTTRVGWSPGVLVPS